MHNRAVCSGAVQSLYASATPLSSDQPATANCSLDRSPFLCHLSDTPFAMKVSTRARLLLVLGVSFAFVSVVYCMASAGRTSKPTHDVSAEPATQKETPSSPRRPLGLHVLHQPRTQGNTVNLVFVHGLGGDARGTWTHDSSGVFWPTLLYNDDRFENVRVSTFGYNANFGDIFATKSALDIPDFAKQLLDSLDLELYDRFGDVRDCQSFD
jgi:hypothetical protein